MKKITLIVAFIGMITLQSCVREEVVVADNVDYDTISEVFELKNVDFNYNNSSGSYFIYRQLNPQIFASDVVLIYRMSDLINSNTPVWQLIPRTLYLNEGELDYDFDFSKQDFTIYAGGNFDLEFTPEYIYNQTFRIVIIPGYFSNKNANPVDYNNYEEVIKYYDIDEKGITKL